MANHSPTPGDQGNTDPIAELEARLGEIESGILDPISFTSSTLIQTTFPHSRRAGKEIVLVNGDRTVTMYSRHGLPYGSYPRLLMCWLTREALRRKDMPLDEARVIPLEGSARGFMREVGISHVTGGKDGSLTLIKRQMKSLFATTIGVDYEGDRSGRTLLDLDNSRIADSAHVWWDPQPQDQINFKGHVTLSPEFFRDISTSAVPLDTGIIRDLRRSPMALDVYSWLSYRLSYLRGISVIRWDQIRGQLGAGYPATSQGMRNFRKKFLAALGKVLQAWPEATISVTDVGIMLRPGDPSVPRRIQDEIKKRFPDRDDNPF